MKDAKKTCRLLKMRTLSHMNDLYNFQYTIMLCEICESRAMLMHEKYGCNPRWCNLASTLGSCIQRNQPSCTSNEQRNCWTFWENADSWL